MWIVPPFNLRLAIVFHGFSNGQTRREDWSIYKSQNYRKWLLWIFSLWHMYNMWLGHVFQYVSVCVCVSIHFHTCNHNDEDDLNHLHRCFRGATTPRDHHQHNNPLLSVAHALYRLLAIVVLMCLWIVFGMVGLIVFCSTKSMCVCVWLGIIFLGWDKKKRVQ